MAKSTKASKALGKIGKTSAASWTKSRDKEAQIKGARLPGGIIGGVSKLIDHKIDETEEHGVPYVVLTFLILEPEEHNGKKERKSYFFQDSPEFDKTQDDVLDEFSSALQIMGIETKGTDISDWDKLLKKAIKDETFVEFGTRQGKIKDGENAGQQWNTFDLHQHLPDYKMDEESETEYTEKETTDSDGEGEGWIPKVGEEYFYQKKEGKKKKKCKVVVVDIEKETVGIILAKNNKEVADVSWDHLKGENDD